MYENKNLYMIYDISNRSTGICLLYLAGELFSYNLRELYIMYIMLTSFISLEVFVIICQFYNSIHSPCPGVFFGLEGIILEILS